MMLHDVIAVKQEALQPCADLKPENTVSRHGLCALPIETADASAATIDAAKGLRLFASLDAIVVRSFVPTEQVRNGICAAIAAIFFVIPQAKAQSLPGPSMNIPEASSKRGFDWGVSLGFDYITSAKCSLLNTSFSCTSAGSSAFSISPAVMAQFNRLRLQVTVPYVDIEGPGTLSGALGTPRLVGQASSPVQRRSGVGDVSVGGAFIIMREGRILPRLEVAGVVKLPTAGRGLGTREIDYGAQVTFYRPLLRGVSTFGSVGYQRIGDPNTLRLHDGERATLGLDINYSNWGGGALVEYKRSSYPGLPNSLTVDPYVTFPFIGGIAVQAYTTIALTRESPNHEFGIRFVL